MILPVLQYPDPRLKKKSLPIDEITPEIRELAVNMIETMYARNGIGLAAPQVGAHVRLIVVDLSGPEKQALDQFPRLFSPRHLHDRSPVIRPGRIPPRLENAACTSYP